MIGRRAAAASLAGLAVAAWSAACRRGRREGGDAAPDGSAVAPGDATRHRLDAGDRLSERARAAMEAAKVPGIAVATLRAGAVATTAAFGLADVEGGVPVTATTVFEGASLAKPVVAAAVLKLVETGALSLDADVAKLLPFPFAHPRHPRTRVTPRMLLAHASSLKDDVPLLKTPASPAQADLLARYVASPAHWYDEPPATRVVYANAGYAVLGAILARVARRPFDAYVRDAVLSPLGMVSARWRAADVAPPWTLARPHRWSAARGAFDRLAPVDHALAAPVDLRATAADLAAFLAMLARGGRGATPAAAACLAPATVALMLAPAYPDLDGGAQRLGLYAITIDGRKLLGHEGEDEGASTAMLMDPTTRDAAVVLSNGDAFTSDDPARARAIAAFVGSSVGDAG